MNLKLAIAAILLSIFPGVFSAQNFRFGADLSYVNEMEDCGVVYRENGQPADPYETFAAHGHNIVRLRLWHTPAWLDTLNAGKRYSDFADVRRSLLRTRAAGMEALLDFHLSDLWADPGRQILPKAWEGVANNLPALKDSVRNYISQTLLALHADGLLPEMVQIGNETNRGILQTRQANDAGWVLDWPRNAALFKTAIEAVRAVEAQTGRQIRVALHIAGPADAGWLMQGFWSNGVRDFDIIGLSYYWAWHKPTTIAQTGAIIRQLRTLYPGKSVMIFETGYVWTLQNHDGANNIINETHPTYAPASPAAQKRWMTDLAQEVMAAGGEGVMYWEPAWVSSPCRTPWGQGSHQEHATFFDFSSNVLPAGGMSWPEHPYPALDVSPGDLGGQKPAFKIAPDEGGLLLSYTGFPPGTRQEARLFDSTGRAVAVQKFEVAPGGEGGLRWTVAGLVRGVYFVSVAGEEGARGVRRVLVK